MLTRVAAAGLCPTAIRDHSGPRRAAVALVPAVSLIAHLQQSRMLRFRRREYRSRLPVWRPHRETQG